MKYFLFGLLITLFVPQFAWAEENINASFEVFQNDSDTIITEHLVTLDSISPKQFRKMKITAVALAVTLGVFGVHRLYLGTTARIPITYTLTLGGGFFVLPAIDIVYIILAKNPEQLKNNSSIFMWNKTKKDNL